MNESGLWKRIKKANPDAHLERIENSVGVGTPDVNFCTSDASGWIELKYLEPTPTGHYNLSLKKYPTHQRNWHADYLKLANPYSFVALLVGIGEHNFWLMGRQAVVLTRFSLGEITEWSFADQKQIPTQLVFQIAQQKALASIGR